MTSADLCEVFADGPCELGEVSQLDGLDATEEIGAAVGVLYLRPDGGLYVHQFPLGPGARLVGLQDLALEVTDPAAVNPSAHLSVGLDDEENPLPVLVIEGDLRVTEAGIQ